MLAMKHMAVATDKEPDGSGRCPTCGRQRPGRPRLDVDVQNVMDSLRKGNNVEAVARQFGISRTSVIRIRESANVDAERMSGIP